MVPEIRPFFHGRRSGLSFFRKFFICSLALAFTAFIASPEQIHCEPLSLGETTEMGADLDMGTNSIILGENPVLAGRRGRRTISATIRPVRISNWTEIGFPETGIPKEFTWTTTETWESEFPIPSTGSK